MDSPAEIFFLSALERIWMQDVGFHFNLRAYLMRTVYIPLMACFTYVLTVPHPFLFLTLFGVLYFLWVKRA